VGRSDVNSLVGPYMAGETGEMVYQRTKTHNNSPTQVTLPIRLSAVCR
jgi:hypothetical protein